jgi:hypothetical protein
MAFRREEGRKGTLAGWRWGGGEKRAGDRGNELAS